MPGGRMQSERGLLLALLTSALLSTALSAPGLKLWMRQAPPPLDVPYCRFFGLRHILAASDRDNGGLRRCGVCTFDAEWCTVLCAYCLDSSDSPSPSEVSLELTHCRPTEGEIVVDGEGYLMCRMAPNPPDTPMPPPEPPVYPPPPPPATPVTLTGTVEVYTSHLYNSPNRTAPDMSYAVTFSNESTGYSLKATFNLGALADTADVQTGDRLSFKVTAAPPGSRRRLMSNCDEITGLCFDPAAAEGNSTTSGKDFVVDGKAVNITSIVMLATVCGALPRISLDKLRSTLFNADQASAVNTRNVTLQHYYATCSYGKIQFRPENNLVTTVNLPCTALYQTSASGVQTWYKSQTSCDAPELYGWMRDGLTQAATNLGLASTTPYKRKVLFLPNRQACDWPGMASVGCDTSCNTWINQMSPTNVDVQVLFQELGHNIGLQHANRWIDGVNQEYEDFTDPMGTGWVENDDFQNKTMICLGAAEAYKAGWALPAASFNLTEDLVPGSPVTVTIPSMHVTDTNFLYINVTSLPPFKPSWPGNAQPLNRTHQLFISYRVRQPAPGFDSGLTPEMSKKVYVHNYNATLRSPPRPDPGDVAMKSSLIAVLGTQRGSVKGMDVNTAFRFDFGPLVGGRTPVNGLHIAPLSLGPDSATLSVCYFAVARESDVEGGCGNGIDDDCDGYVDGDDTDCGGVRSPPPTKSPPPPPPTKSPPPPPPVKPPPPPPVKPLPPPPVKSPPPPPVKPPPPPPVKSPPPVKPPPQLPPPAKSPPPPPPSASSPPSPPPPLAASTKSPPPPAKNPPSPPKKRPPPPTGSSGHRHHHHRSRRSQLLESHDLRQ